MSNRAHLLWIVVIMAGAFGCRDRTAMQHSFDYKTIHCAFVVAPADVDHFESARDTLQNVAVRTLRALDPDDPSSDLGKLNKIAATSRWPVPAETQRALDLAIFYSRETRSMYDVTTTPLSHMWGLGLTRPPLQAPIPEVLQAARAGVGLDKIAMEGRTFAFLSPLTSISLGPVASAYALDLGLIDVRRRAIANTMLRFGNATRCLGMKDLKTPWTEDLPHPLETDRTLGRWTFREAGALVQARIYEPSVTIEGVRYSGTIDPRNGMPVSNTLAVAVSGPTATIASILAQALMVAGVPEGTNVLSRFPRYEALILTAGNPPQLWATASFQENFTPDPSISAPIQLLVPAPPEPEKDTGKAQPSDEMIAPESEKAP